MRGQTNGYEREKNDAGRQETLCRHGSLRKGRSEELEPQYRATSPRLEATRHTATEDARGPSGSIHGAPEWPEHHVVHSRLCRAEPRA